MKTGTPFDDYTHWQQWENYQDYDYYMSLKYAEEGDEQQSQDDPIEEAARGEATT